MEKTSSSKFLWTSETISFFLSILFIFILPLTFAPSQYINFLFSKTVLLFAVTIILLFLFIFKVFRDGRYRISWHPLFWISLFIPIWYIFSSFFALNVHNALLGTGIETDTATMVAILFLFLFLGTYFFRGKDKIFLAYFAFGISYAILAIFQTLRLFFGVNFLSFHLFLTTTSNTVGKWNEIAIISGVALLLSLISIEFLRLTRGFKIFAYVVLVLSLFLAAVTNFPIIYENTFSVSFFALIGIFSLVFFVYFLSSSYQQSRKETEMDEEKIDLKKRKIPVASLIVLIISVIFTFGFNEIGSFVQTHFNVSSYEERPTWKWTSEVGLASIKQRPFTGYGPNNFNASWTLNKPAEVNNTAIWNDDFVSGVGYIPTSLINTGPIGFLAWLIFLGLFIFFGVKSLFFKYKDRFSHYLTVSSFLVGLFLWIVALLYSPTTVVLALTFLFTALFFSSLLREGMMKEKAFVFENSKERTFISIMALVLILVGSIFWAYEYGRVFASNIYASKGAVQYANAASEDDLIKAQDFYVNALRLQSSDIYLRAITNINLSRAQLLLNNQSLPADQLRANFLTSYQNAYGAANDAVKFNSKDYLNYISRGAVSESIVSLGVQTVQGSGVADAYEDAKSNYQQAEKLNPRSPVLPLLIARLDLAKKDYDSAKQEIGNALALRGSYPDAYLLLAQIEVTQNNTQGAIDTLTAGTLVAPDQNLFFTLGSLYYSKKDYANAISAFEKAVTVNPYYSNARYYLALSYYNSGRTNDALTQLQQIKSLNPGNTDIDALISTFQSGGPVSVQTASTTAETITQ